MQLKKSSFLKVVVLGIASLCLIVFLIKVTYFYILDQSHFKHRAELTEERLNQLQETIEKFKDSCGSYPPTGQLKSSIYLKTEWCGKSVSNNLSEESFLDGWSQEYNYESNGKEFILSSKKPYFSQRKSFTEKPAKKD